MIRCSEILFMRLVELRRKEVCIKVVLLKEVALDAIKRLPDECKLEDIMYELNLVSQVLEGLKDAEDGRLISTEELLKRVEQWER